MIPRTECSSRIRHVDVFAHGAAVTRTVDIAALSHARCEVVIPRLRADLIAGSVKARARGKRPVLMVSTHRSVDATRDATSPLEEAQRALLVERWDIELRLETLRARLALLAQARPDPKFPTRFATRFPEKRIDDALAATELLATWTREDTEARAELADRHMRVVRKLQDVAGELQQRSTQERSARATNDLCVLLGAGDDLAELEVTYGVAAVRWWPRSVLRVSNGGAEVSWELGASVAQETGEDWDQVTMSLSTVMPARNVALPELLSLRLGRAQARRNTGYRAVPEGLERMFAGYDAIESERIHRAGPRPTRTAPPPSPRPPPRSMSMARQEEGLEETTGNFDVKAALDDALDSFGAVGAVGAGGAVGAVGAVGAGGAGGAGGAVGAGGAGGASRADAFLQASDGAMSMPEEASIARSVPMRSMARRSAAIGSVPRPQPKSRATDEVDVSDTWLDFDELEVHGPNGPARGQLVRAPAWTSASQARVFALPTPRFADDPATLAARGHQARYSLESPVDVASDAKLHRLRVATRKAESRVRFCAAPRVEQQVYRQLFFTNPHDHMVLPGPADVYLDGSFLSEIGHGAVGPRGSIYVGLGTESRIRMARNTQVEERTEGLLRGKIGVSHSVAIDLASSLGFDARVEVFDRLPVTDDKEVEVELESSSVPWRAYDQADRGAPIRGGRVWTVDVPKGGQTRLAYAYNVSFSAKLEIIGGNRRE